MPRKFDATGTNGKTRPSYGNSDGWKDALTALICSLPEDHGGIVIEIVGELVRIEIKHSA